MIKNFFLNPFSKKKVDKIDILNEIPGGFSFKIIKYHGLHHGWNIYTIKIKYGDVKKVKTILKICSLIKK
jgi:hypothetical protein